MKLRKLAWLLAPAIGCSPSHEETFSPPVTPVQITPVAHLVTGNIAYPVYRISASGGVCKGAPCLKMFSPNKEVLGPGRPFKLTGTGTACDGRDFVSNGVVDPDGSVTFNTELSCLFDFYAMNTKAVLTNTANGNTTFVTALSTYDGIVTANLRVNYGNFFAAATGNTVSIAGTGTACDGKSYPVTAAAAVNPVLYKVRFPASDGPCTFTNWTQQHRAPIMVREQSGKLWLFDHESAADAAGGGSYYGEPNIIGARTSVDRGVTWSDPVALFSDSSGACNHVTNPVFDHTDNCNVMNFAAVTAPNGNLVAGFRTHDAKSTRELFFAVCNPGSADCSVPANWKITPYKSYPTGVSSWLALYGMSVLVNGDLAVQVIAGGGQPGPLWWLISHDNGLTWSTQRPITDLGSYTKSPTNEVAIHNYAPDRAVGFGRNGPWSSACRNQPPLLQCGSDNGHGNLLAYATRDGGASWTISNAMLPVTQPVCGGTDLPMRYLTYVAPQIVPSPSNDGRLVLLYGERQQCHSGTTMGYMKSITFDPEAVAANPLTIGDPKTLDSNLTQFIGYQAALVPVPGDPLLVVYEKQASACNGASGSGTAFPVALCSVTHAP